MHYTIMKYVFCDLSGERCGNDFPYDKSVVPRCGGCEYFEEYLQEKYPHLAKDPTPRPSTTNAPTPKNP